MSHMIKATTTMTNNRIIELTAERLGLRFEQKSQHRFDDGNIVIGVSVWLPGWRRPIVIADNGELCYDSWLCDETHLQKFRQLYTQIFLEDFLTMSGFALTSNTPGDNGELVLEFAEIGGSSR